MSRRMRRRIHISTGSVFFDVLPLLAIPMLYYNFVVFAGFAGSTPAAIAAWMISPTITIPMFSGAVLSLSVSDIILFASMPLLFFEIVKSARSDALSVMNHIVSTLTLLIGTIEFVAVQGFSTAVFCLIVIMQLVDVIAGFTVTIAAARRGMATTIV